MLTMLRHYHDAVDTSHAKSYCRVATGRQAIAYLIEKLAPERVFMPAYVADGVLEPFQKANIPITHYRLNKHLMMDEQHISELLAAYLEADGRRALLMLIHYFGNPGYTMRQCTKSEDNPVFILRDCAQDLFADPQCADFTLYSLNKWLPVTDGAILVSNREDVDVSVAPGWKMYELPPSIVMDYQRHLNANTNLCRRGSPTSLRVSESAYEDYYREMRQIMRPLAQSHTSRAVESAANYPAMGAIRRINHGVFAEPNGVPYAVVQRVDPKRLNASSWIRTYFCRAASIYRSHKCSA